MYALRIEYRRVPADDGGGLQAGSQDGVVFTCGIYCEHSIMDVDPYIKRRSENIYRSKSQGISHASGPEGFGMIYKNRSHFLFGDTLKKKEQGNIDRNRFDIALFCVCRSGKS